MGYLHIINLYRPDGKDILLFKECYALEKIHGTSAHIGFDPRTTTGGVELPPTFFSGGEKYQKFQDLFNQEDLYEKLEALSLQAPIAIFGEAYGGAQQGMSATYGKELKFICFDVKIGNSWLDVPSAEQIVQGLGLEFVSYEKIPTDLSAIDAQMLTPSVQAERNGMGSGHAREGIVLRPLIEVTKNNGERIIAKHKNEAFIETEKPRKLDKPLEVLENAEAVAIEWVTEMRLTHVLQKLPYAFGIESTGKVITAMLEDIEREGSGEYVPSKDVSRAIAKRTATLYKQRVMKVSE